MGTDPRAAKMTDLISYSAEDSKRMQVVADEWSLFLLGLAKIFDLESISEIVAETGWPVEEVSQRWNRIVDAGLAFRDGEMIEVSSDGESLLARLRLYAPQRLPEHKRFLLERSPLGVDSVGGFRGKPVISGELGRHAGLSPEMWEALVPLMARREFPEGAILYQSGVPATGLYIVQTGAVRLMLSMPDSNQLLEVAGPGSILGLSESLSGDPYRLTAEAKERATVAFIRRDRFLEFLDQQQDFSMQVVRLLSESLHGLYHKFRSVSTHPGRPRRLRPKEEPS
jgi:CRP-like cAMP-binding protein